MPRGHGRRGAVNGAASGQEVIAQGPIAQGPTTCLDPEAMTPTAATLSSMAGGVPNEERCGVGGLYSVRNREQSRIRANADHLLGNCGLIFHRRNVQILK